MELILCKKFFTGYFIVDAVDMQKFKKLNILLLVLSLFISFSSCKKTSGDDEMKVFVDALLSKMTLEEKLGQLNLPASDDIITGISHNANIGKMIADGKVGGIFNIKGLDKIDSLQRIAVEESRLGIPLIFGMDVIHGYETVFPIPLALSCSWDTIGIRKTARIAATEASANGVCWTFSPMVDICRDPRWGRCSEGSGEDPFLGAAIAKVMVEGYQGQGFKNPNEIMACVKHFALYGAPEGGRDYNTVDMSRQRMFNEYFSPYKAGADAGAASFMTSFNTIDGIPATANRWLLTDVLRGMWGFSGFVVTDYTAIAEMIDHGLGDLQKVSALALKAGTDMDMVSDGFISTLPLSLSEGKVNLGEIDAAVRRILEAKYKLGLFEDPYKFINSERSQKETFTKDNREYARKIASETFVLLKNENNVLPLSKKGRIALIGPLGNTPANMPGTWSVAADLTKSKSLFEGLKDAVGNQGTVMYAKGCNLTDDPVLEANATMFGREMRDPRSADQLLKEALNNAQNSDVIVAALGESSEFSGESTSRSDLTLPDAQKRLLEALLKTGKPIVMLNFSGRPTILTWESENIPAILNVWFGGTEAADAICDVIFGDVSPSGKLTMSMPRNMGQIPVYYNCMNTGRPKSQDNSFEKFRSGYIDSPNSPLYPFGFGLSYTSFDYSDLELSSSSFNANGSISASVKVTNTGNYDSDEIVQLYLRDKEASSSRPVKELKGFRRISLKKGESKTVEFTINSDMLKFYNYELEYVAEPGEFEIMIGPDSQSTLNSVFTYTNS